MRHRIAVSFLVSLALVVGLAIGAPPAAEAAGKDFVIGFLGDATSLNPVIATDGQSYIAEWPIYDSLVELDEKLGVKPLLAESWEVSRDGLTYTFKLKKGVKWHDGKPFTARDVAFTFYSVLDPKVTTPHRGYFDALVGFPELTNKDNPEEARGAGAEADRGPRRLHDPLPAALSVRRVPRGPREPARRHRARAHPEGPGPEHDGVQPEADRDRPVQVRRVEAGERIVLEANPDYHGGRPALDRLIYRVIPDAVVLLQELRAGGVDFIERPPLTEVSRLKQTAGLKVITADNTLYTYFGFRQDLAPFDDIRVRRALYHAIDIPAIVREVLQGYGVVATGQFAPSSWAFDPSVKPYPYDPNRAKALLAESGWKPGPDGILVKDGKRLSFSLRHDQADQTTKDTAIIIQEFLKKIGVEATVEPLDWPTFVKKLFASEFEGIVVGWTNFHDPDPFAYSIWHSGQWKARNFAHYKSPRADAALEAARQARDQAERKKHYAEFSKILMEDAPYVFLYFPQQVYVTRQSYDGFVPIPAYGGIYQSMKAVKLTGR